MRDLETDKGIQQISNFNIFFAESSFNNHSFIGLWGKIEINFLIMRFTFLTKKILLTQRIPSL